MTAPRAKGGGMPQVIDFEDYRIKATANFRGIRRVPLLRWFPYITGQRPSISLLVQLKDKKENVKVIAIECDPPKHREDNLYNGNYGWYTTDIKIGEQYDITLPVLDRAGNYEYRVNVSMLYEDRGTYSSISSIGKIMSTGQVYWQENVGTHILAVLFGCAVGAMLAYLIPRLFN